MTETRQCEKEGCITDAIECFVSTEETALEYLCPFHAAEAGYCAACGRYSAGIESYDFPDAHNNIRGYCDECSDQIRADMGEYDQDEYDDYGEADPYV